MENRPPKLDGLGQPITPDGLYYVQDSRSYVGNAVSWWRPDGQGYTCDLDDAGKYKGTSVSRRDSDVAWPIDYVHERATRVVDMQRLKNTQTKGERGKHDDRSQK